MKNSIRLIMVAAAILVVIILVIQKQNSKPDVAEAVENAAAEEKSHATDQTPCSACIDSTSVADQPEYAPSSLPRLVELGSTTCRNCKIMAAILDTIETTYEDELIVEFHDVKKNPDIARQFGIRLIPTQIFIDTTGREVFRHEGLLPKDEIVAVLNGMGVSP